MKEIIFNVNGQQLRRNDKLIIVGDSIGQFNASFILDSWWDGFDITAQFTKDDVTYDIPVVDGRCTVPHEVLSGIGLFSVSLFALNGTGERKTTNEVFVPLEKSGLKNDGLSPSPATPTKTDEIYNLLNKLKGGSAKKVLAKKTAQDYDFKWDSVQTEEVSAENVTYDNSTVQITETNIQKVIDKLFKITDKTEYVYNIPEGSESGYFLGIHNERRNTMTFKIFFPSAYISWNDETNQWEMLEQFSEPLMPLPPNTVNGDLVDMWEIPISSGKITLNIDETLLELPLDKFWHSILESEDSVKYGCIIRIQNIVMVGMDNSCEYSTEGMSEEEINEFRDDVKATVEMFLSKVQFTLDYTVPTRTIAVTKFETPNEEEDE